MVAPVHKDVLACADDGFDEEDTSHPASSVESSFGYWAGMIIAAVILALFFFTLLLIIGAAWLSVKALGYPLSAPLRRHINISKHAMRLRRNIWPVRLAKGVSLLAAIASAYALAAQWPIQQTSSLAMGVVALGLALLGCAALYRSAELVEREAEDLRNYLG